MRGCIPRPRAYVGNPTPTTSDFELRAQVSRALAAGYELEEEIGRGGMGIVYRARDRRLKRMVAVKLLPPELAYRSEIRSRFLREAETSAQLNHPNIVPIYTVGEDDKVVYFIMAYVQGDNLAKVLSTHGRVDWDEARRILRDVADALAYAHARKVIHRDIKPDNILIDSETGRVWVTDFGIARAVTETAGSRLTATGMALGTPAYMSPEQAAGDRELDGRSDLYSLGIVGYQLLCGDLPFQAPNTPAMLVKHLSETPRPIGDLCPNLPDDLARAVMLCLEKNPEDRFPTASALVVALEGGPFPHSAEWPAQRTAERDFAPQRQSYPVATRPPTELQSAQAEDVSRWNAPIVRKFRKKLAPYIAVNAVLLPIGLFTGFDPAIPVFAVWSVILAIQYSKLWAAGYDWRDVFRQPRDRLFVDVAAEKMDEARAIFDKEKRAEIRERVRTRPPLRGGRERVISSGRVPSADTSPVRRETPEVARARADRDEIHRLLDALPEQDRDLIRDVGPSADALFDRVQSLAASVATLERHDIARELVETDREINDLEARANPLEHEASEQRVRRLAGLRRRRRGLVELRRRRDDSRAKLESCRIAMQNVRLDVLRLHSGTQSYQNVTLVAEQAMQLARDVDSFVHAVDESARATVAAR
jgi:serine/threonine protein kinase